MVQIEGGGGASDKIAGNKYPQNNTDIRSEREVYSQSWRPRASHTSM